MEKRILHIFQLEIERQCKFSLIAIQDLFQAQTANDIDRIWYSIQGLLVAVGIISKILWPPSSLESRGKELRRSLSIEVDSPLAPRKFRNHFEHFDERLENWAVSSKHSHFVDSNIGPPGMIIGIEPSDFIRNFDTINLAVTFRGDSYYLQPIITAIHDLWQKVEFEIEKPF
jgi:hypothetical protein